LAATDITSKRLRALTEPLGTPNSMNQASCDPARLRPNGLITRISDRNRCPRATRRRAIDPRLAHTRTS
jgi:hypothetical protein